jgi:hypothetical protein
MLIRGVEGDGATLVGVLVLLGLYCGPLLALYRRVEISHLNTGLKWQQSSLLGYVRKRVLTTNPERLPVDLALSRPLACPPSVTQFPEMSAVWSRTATKDAIPVIRAALLGLLAQEMIQVYRCQEYVAWWRQGFEQARNIHMLAPTEKALVTSVDGALESKMMDVLQSWARTEKLLSTDKSTVYQLARSVYERDVSDPDRWMTDLVAKDAVARGWARSVVAGKKRLEVEAIDPERLRSEKNAVGELSFQLDELHPDFSRELNKQIADAIRSREQQPDDYVP